MISKNNRKQKKQNNMSVCNKGHSNNIAILQHHPTLFGSLIYINGGADTYVNRNQKSQTAYIITTL